MQRLVPRVYSEDCPLGLFSCVVRGITRARWGSPGSSFIAAQAPQSSTRCTGHGQHSGGRA